MNAKRSEVEIRLAASCVILNLRRVQRSVAAKMAEGTFFAAAEAAAIMEIAIAASLRDLEGSENASFLQVMSDGGGVR
jgi:hypothetical protein